jgi:hypothetical protein
VSAFLVTYDETCHLYAEWPRDGGGGARTQLIASMKDVGSVTPLERMAISPHVMFVRGVRRRSRQDDDCCTGRRMFVNSANRFSDNGRQTGMS